MKYIILVTFILLCSSAKAVTDTHKHPDGLMQTTYTCPMHPDVHSAKPGKCPKCGMPLVARKAPAKKPAVLGKKPAGRVKKPATRVKSPQTPAGPTDKTPKPDTNVLIPSADSNRINNSYLDQAIRLAKKNLGSVTTFKASQPPRTVRYDLYIADTLVNFTGKPRRAIAVNGQIPMPELIFTEGDTAEIYVHNRLKEATSLHWHGLFVPNRYDGVPNLTQKPIEPGTTYVYRFPIIQHGTHWYHSHSGLQEQIGMYGSFTMLKRNEWNIPTLPVILSEWTNMRPQEVDRRLHAGSDWFAIQKGSTQSYSEALKTGNLKVKLHNEWKRMTAMDVSDVYYNRFLVNGRAAVYYPELAPGSKVRLRIANAGASSYFWLTYSGGKMTVVASDGNDVEPVEVDRLIVAVAETYDIVVTIPGDKSYELLATPEDRTGSASMWLGKGEPVPSARLPRLDYFAGMNMMNEMIDMKGNLVEVDGMHMQNQAMDMNTVMYPELTKQVNGHDHHNHDSLQSKMAGMNGGPAAIVTLNYNHLRAPQKTVLSNGPWRELSFNLTGNMSRYVWTLDNRTVSESDRILIRKGENLRIILFNNSMMRHPMHLHGHDFRLRNGQDQFSPMKNTFDIMPMERDTIEFTASEPGGDWFFHCHILYHMMSGMGRIMRYDNTEANPELPNPRQAQRRLFRDDRMFHLMGSAGLESNGSDGEVMYANTRYRFSAEWRIGLKGSHGNEVETYFGRYLDRMQWWFPFIGFDYHRNRMIDMPERNLFGQQSNQNNRSTMVAGIQYTLPMLLVAEARMDGKGKFRVQVMREDVPLTPRLRLNLMGNTDREYMGGLRYILSKHIGLSTHYDSDMGYGAGITLVY